VSFQHLVVALAGNEDEKHLIRTAIQLAQDLQARLTVLHVNHPGVGKPHMKMDAPKGVAEDDLRELIRAAGHQEEADTVDIRIVEGHPYHEQISKATGTADLMIIGHSQRNAFVAAFINSVDEKVANVARCPVVVVPKS
jgi:nucleotide-binding universal stress UspA family protein